MYGLSLDVDFCSSASYRWIEPAAGYPLTTSSIFSLSSDLRDIIYLVRVTALGSYLAFTSRRQSSSLAVSGWVWKLSHAFLSKVIELKADREVIYSDDCFRGESFLVNRAILL